MIRRPPRSTLSSSSAASDVYKRELHGLFSSKFGSEPACSWNSSFFWFLKYFANRRVFANQCVNRLPIVILNPWNLNHSVKMIIQVCSKVHVLFPFSIYLLKLHLNHTAIFTPNPAYLRDRAFIGVFGM